MTFNTASSIPDRQNRKLENMAAIVSEIDHLLDAVENHIVNRHKALEHPA